MRRLLAFLLFVLIAARSAPAADPLAELSQRFLEDDAFQARVSAHWGRYFPGEPLGQPDFQELGSLLRTPEKCVINRSELKTRVRSYYDAARRGDSDSALKIHASLIRHVEDYREQGPECHHAALGNYVYASFSVALLFMLDRREEFTLAPTDEFFLNYGTTIGYVGAALYNEGRIRWLDPALRQDSDGPRSVLGAYDCETSTIYLDPGLGPLNLAAVFVHELDHLFRDKFLQPDFSTISLRNYLVLDESLAGVHAAFLQRTLRYVPIINELHGMSISPSAFSLSSDGDLYSRNGSVDRLWTLLKGLRSKSRDPFRDPFHFDRFLSETFLRADQEYPAKEHLDASVIAPFWTEVYALFSQAYFGRAPLTEELLQLNPARLGLEHSPLSGFAAGNSVWRDLHPGPRLRTFSDVPGIPVSQLHREHLNNANYILVGLDSLLGKVTEPSPFCRAFRRGIESGELRDYVGSQLQPGTEGVKPGTEGVKPGTEGVKPSRGLRPCLHLHAGP